VSRLREGFRAATLERNDFMFEAPSHSGLSLAHDLAGKPASIFSDHALKTTGQMARPAYPED
jgi:hypothetical protein